ncbi:MAG: Crp/Fnr family transcriptional regulator [Coriobacteriia bacterium]|nr:Crp/Fnr family transcriptional regulator [Coriobacteriia bacterium]
MTADKTPLRPDVHAALRECRLWRGASDAAIDALVSAARVKEVPRGTTLVTEGEPAEHFGVLVTGKARVFHLGADGRRITFETLSAGDPVAVVAALAGGRYPAHAETVTPATVAWLPREALFELMESEPAVARAVMTDLANRVVGLTSVVQTLALDVPSRLARYLFQRALAVGTPSSHGLEVDLGMPKSELAAALGTVPETLSRAFAKLREDELVEVHGKWVTVLDVRRLATLGSGYSEE